MSGLAISVEIHNTTGKAMGCWVTELPIDRFHDFRLSMPTEVAQSVGLIGKATASKSYILQNWLDSPPPVFDGLRVSARKGHEG